MCGIIGCISDDLSNSQKFLNDGLSLLKNRGPDGQRKFQYEGVSLGHSRLSVIDLSDESSQPIISNSGNSVMVYNGMLYNYDDLQISQRYTFHKYLNSDTKFLVEFLDTFGVTKLNELEGMFALGVFNVISNELTLIRDRFGIKPLYYLNQGNSFYFSSTIKPLLKVINQKEVNLEVVDSYLRFNRIDDTENTFFTGIKKLMPGNYLKYNLNTQLIKIFNWNTFNLTKSPMSDEFNVSKQLRLTISQSISKHTISDVPVGLLLSGGLDSSIIAAEVSRLRSSFSEKIPAYFIDFKNSKYSEREFAETASSYFGLDLKILEISEHEIAERLSNNIQSQEEPFGGVMTLCLNYLFESAKKDGLKVMLDGSGLDDLLGGYESHLSTYLAQLSLENPEKFAVSIKLYAATNQITVHEAILRIEPFSNFKNFAGIYLDGSRNNSHSFLRNQPKGEKSESEGEYTNLDEIMLNSLIKYKTPRALRFKDKVSMNSSIELRVPFLDNNVASLCHSIPNDLIFAYGETKSSLRQAYRDVLPISIVNARKRSVQSPQSEWLVNGILNEILVKQLSHPNELLLEILDTSKASEYVLSKSMIMQEKNLNHLWQWMNLSLWYEEFF
jgi:asparagine synthase (glutamine-hydrolysing)